mmetsp:Transcript_72195/g.167307  ORF Transcript_72195/g.167307 Transcript_72195/m.167307 type:complete len:497 (-) Transcript_72195:440-1930(-)|eukprot:CAMPEP_0171145354 /NCGR_PEP_ID=MMETSP0766_2-20121228/147018_1 /TAXON_ID=439317 /ORGANISM="Gambierdiscus australes, Strain CAWD 149" /LENGTH=496 /DNA_ID=CAMNT_0011609257 /DNA_START=82 /DNA_END=1572 /DNA_ORIENTATION=-
MRDESEIRGFDADEIEALKGRIMADIEAKLVQKEESLWRRGQVEIRKLQLEQQQVTQSINKMQDKQATLTTENQKIRGVILEVTSKFERVVNEMREVLRTLPQRRAGEQLSPSPSVASTSASEVARDEHSFEQPSEQNSICTANEQSGAWSSVSSRGKAQTPATQTPAAQTPVPMWHTRGSGEGLTELPSFDVEEFSGTGDGRTFSTPPRGSPLQEEPGQQTSSTLVAPPPPQSWRLGTVASPAPAVLSLASALPSASHITTPSPGLKRLHLAEHIEQQANGSTMESMRPVESAASATSGSGCSQQRSDLLTVELAKEPGFVTLGMEVKQIDGCSLRIESIDEHGLVGRHNLRQDSESNKVLVGDRIIEANGVRTDPNRMLQECKVRQRLVFTLLRGADMLLGAGKDLAASDEDLAEKNLVGSPLPTRLRPEARIFVPSARKDPTAPAPPGLEGYDVAGLPGASAITAVQHVQAAETIAELGPPVFEEEVKRALFS